jgi:CheY-like chemotaxis protein
MARIAVIDDVPTNRELLVTVLAALGHATIEAADGASGFELVRRERPELVICDVLMPAVDGYEFVRRLRADPGVAATPVIFSTAHYLDAEARALASACGVDEILAKPTEPEELVRVVNRVLGQAPAPRRGVPPPEFDRQHLQLMTGKLSDKVAELQRANGKLEALIGLSLELASQRDPAQLLERVCGCARQLIDAAYGSVAVRETDGEALAFVRHSGIAPEVQMHLGPVALEAGALGDVYRGQTPLRLERAALRAALGGLPAAYPPLHSLLAAPVTSLTACYGWICLGNKQAEGGFTETDADLLAMLAAQAGRIYESGSLYARVQAHARTLEAEIADRERAQRQLAAQFTTRRTASPKRRPGCCGRSAASSDLPRERCGASMRRGRRCVASTSCVTGTEHAPSSSPARAAWSSGRRWALWARCGQRVSRYGSPICRPQPTFCAARRRNAPDCVRVACFPYSPAGGWPGSSSSSAGCRAPPPRSCRRHSPRWPGRSASLSIAAPSSAASSD